MSAVRPAGRVLGGRKAGVCQCAGAGRGGGGGGMLHVWAGGGGEAEWCMGEEVLKVQMQHQHRKALSAVK